MDSFLHTITTILHPHFVQTICYDRHVDQRLEEITAIERDAKDTYGITLFIHCDVESRIVDYYDTDKGQCLTLPFMQV